MSCILSVLFYTDIVKSLTCKRNASHERSDTSLDIFLILIKTTTTTMMTMMMMMMMMVRWQTGREVMSEIEVHIFVDRLGDVRESSIPG